MCFFSSHLLVGAWSLTSGWQTQSPRCLCAAEWRRSTLAEMAGAAGRRSEPRHEAPWGRCWPGRTLHAGAADCSPPAHHHRLTNDNQQKHGYTQVFSTWWRMIQFHEYNFGDWLSETDVIILPLTLYTTTIDYHNVTEVQIFASQHQLFRGVGLNQFFLVNLLQRGQFWGRSTRWELLWPRNTRNGH